jgi:hypothetical protein
MKCRGREEEEQNKRNKGRRTRGRKIGREEERKRNKVRGTRARKLEEREGKRK